MTTTTTPTRPVGRQSISLIFEGPLWLPQHSLANDKERDRLLAKANEKNPGSSAQTALAGIVVALDAYGDRVYGLDVGGVVFKLPEQGILWAKLQAIDLSKKPHFYLEFMGKGDANGKGPDGKPKAAPFLYDVIPMDDNAAAAIVGKANNKTALVMRSKNFDEKPAAGAEEPDHVKGDADRR